MRNSTNEPNYSTDDDDDDTPEEGDCFEYKPTSLGDSSKKKIKNEELFTHNVTSGLDRNKVTDREAMSLIVPITAVLKALKGYEDKEIADAATKVLERHLWYLSTETVGLAFFF